MALLWSEDPGAIKVSLLGRFGVRSPGRDIELRIPHRAEQLLAYLLLHGEKEHHREAIAEALWGDTPGDGRKQLRQALWILQSELSDQIPGTNLVSQDAEWVSLSRDTPLRVDLADFQRRVDALYGKNSPTFDHATLGRAMEAERLYQGHLLEGWNESWVGVPREEALRRYQFLLDALLDHFESLGEHARVILYATRALGADPSRERAHRALIRALHRLGDRSGALRQFQRCVEALRRQHGVEPDGETMALVEEVRGEGSRSRAGSD